MVRLPLRLDMGLDWNRAKKNEKHISLVWLLDGYDHRHEPRKAS